MGERLRGLGGGEGSAPKGFLGGGGEGSAPKGFWGGGKKGVPPRDLGRGGEGSALKGFWGGAKRVTLHALPKVVPDTELLVRLGIGAGKGSGLYHHNHGSRWVGVFRGGRVSWLRGFKEGGVPRGPMAW